VEPDLFLRGAAIGFSSAAPVGPIGMLCIRRSLTSGFLAGFLSGLGAATADGIYGGVAAFGLTAVADLLIAGQSWLRLVGGIFLCYLGFQALRSRPGAEARTAVSTRLAGSYLSTLALTLTNPATILSFVAIFAGLGWISTAMAGRGYDGAALLVAGVFSGSAAWWLLLSGGVTLIRGRITTRMLRWTNRAAGVVITGFGVAALLSLLL
jgi:threonine/homoserine/homoserine lactone efflux protein